MEKKDEMIDLLRQRFAAHEVEAPSGAWEAISGQLAGTAGAEALRTTLQGKFHGHEAPVDPGVWQNISSQLGHGAAATGGIGAGWIAAGVGALVLAGGLLLWDRETPVAQVPAPIPTERSVTTPASGEGPVAVVRVDVPATATEVRTPPAPVHHALVTAPAGEEAVATRPMEPAPATTVPTTTTETAPATSTPASPASQPAAPPPVVIDTAPVQPSARPSTPEPVAAQPAQDRTEPATSTVPDPAEPEPSEDPNANTTIDAANKFFVPNVFTPNNDGRNDKLDVVVNGEELAEVRMRIFSTQNGELVFSSNSLDQLWDGTIHGARAPEGNYLFAIEGIGRDGRSYPFRTVVLLNR